MSEIYVIDFKENFYFFACDVKKVYDFFTYRCKRGLRF